MYAVDAREGRVHARRDIADIDRMRLDLDHFRLRDGKADRDAAFVRVCSTPALSR